MDQWWNRHFPPYSWARLGFGIAAIPFISLLWYPINQEVFTWGRYIVITLMTQVFLAVSYWAIRNGRDELGDTKDEATGPITWRVPRGQPVPSEIPLEQPTTSEEPKEPSEFEREAISALVNPKRKPRVDWRIDFVASLLISFVAFTATLLMMLEEPPGFLGIGMSAVVALMFTTALTFRYSVVTVIGLSVALGLPTAYIARGVFYIMSFFSDQGSIWIWWLICSVGIFSFFAPGWYAMRRNRKKIEGLRIPNWVTTSLVSMFLVVCAAMATAEVKTEIASARPGTQPLPVDEVVASSNFGAGTPEEAALRLYFAWKNGDKKTAGQVAHSQAVAQLFALPFDSSARPLGCGVDAGGYSRCIIRRTNDLLVLTYESTGNGRFYVRHFEHKPLDHPFQYNQPGATPSPTA